MGFCPPEENYKENRKVTVTDMKNIIKNIAVSTVFLSLLSTNASAYSLDFSACEYTGLNNGSFCVRSVEDDMSYKCSGDGEIGFRILGAVSDDIINDSDSIYNITAEVLAESSANNGESAKIKAAITTSGGFVAKEESFEVPVGEWTSVAFSFSPYAQSAFDTVSFSSSAEDDGAETLCVKNVAVEFAGEKYEVVKTINFAKSVYSGGGANAGLNENGVRMGYTLSANQFPFQSGSTENLLMQVNAGNNTGILLVNQLPEFTSEDIGKACKISIKVMPYDANLAGIVLTGYLGTSRVGNTFAYPTDYTEGTITIANTWTNLDYSVLEHEFIVTEELLSNRSVVMWFNNSTTLSPLTYMVDDMMVMMEREY